MSGSWRFSRYEHARKLSVVKEADIATFKWINKNIKDNNYFIGRVEFANTSFLIDASLYLTYFCEKDILLNFVPSEIFNRDKNDDIELYKKWIHGFGKESTIRELLDKNITYVYLGKYPYFGDGGISRDSLEKYREYYKLIYDKDGATIWKISVF